tara:strand:- start:316 stop:573 length:258 start_codon:yes stop_codon:yes gene_type:complete
MINRKEIESLGFILIKESGMRQEYVYYKSEYSTICLEQGGIVIKGSVIPNQLIVKEINKSSIIPLYTGPIKTKEELKFLINLKNA